MGPWWWWAGRFTLSLAFVFLFCSFSLAESLLEQRSAGCKQPRVTTHLTHTLGRHFQCLQLTDEKHCWLLVWQLLVLICAWFISPAVTSMISWHQKLSGAERWNQTSGPTRGFVYLFNQRVLYWIITLLCLAWVKYGKLDVWLLLKKWMLFETRCKNRKVRNWLI